MAGMRAGVGVPTTIALGGKTDPAMGGGPLTLTGEVTHLTNGKFIAYGPMGGGLERDYGPSMVFRVGGIDIALITNNGQAVDLGQFTSLGIDPTRYTTVCVKSMQHFRAAFEPIAREVILADTGALCSELYTPDLFDKGPPPGLAARRYDIGASRPAQLAGTRPEPIYAHIRATGGRAACRLLSTGRCRSRRPPPY
jgi:hypothetical protein